MDDHDRYESLGLDDSMEDERDLDQIMADRRAAEVELDNRERRTAVAGRKLPRLLHDQGELFLRFWACMPYFYVILLLFEAFFLASVFMTLTS